MSAFIEHPRERQEFDRTTERLFGGNPLDHIADTLTVWQKMAPQQGSYAALLAIIANEVAKASDQIYALQHDLSRHLSITSEQATEILGKDSLILLLSDLVRQRMCPSDAAMTTAQCIDTERCGCSARALQLKGK